MTAVARLAASNRDDKIELVCSSGHRTVHSLARILRLNDGWCGKCGADIGYEPSADARRATAVHPLPAETVVTILA